MTNHPSFFILYAPDSFIQEVDALAEKSGSTRVDVIRRALTLYDRAIKEAKLGRVLEFRQVGDM